MKERRAIKKCRFRITTIEMLSVSLSSVTMGLELEIVNPQDIRAVLDRLECILYLNGTAAAGVGFDPVTVPPKGRRTVKAEVQIPFSSLGMRVLDSMKTGGKVRYRLSGYAFVKTAMGVAKVPVTVLRN